MKKQENIINKCGECARYDGGEEGFDCPVLNKTGIENPRVKSDSGVCSDLEVIEGKQDRKVINILKGLVKIEY